MQIKIGSSVVERRGLVVVHLLNDSALCTGVGSKQVVLGFWCCFVLFVLFKKRVMVPHGSSALTSTTQEFKVCVACRKSVVLL